MNRKQLSEFTQYSGMTYASPVAGNQTIQQIPGSSGETLPVTPQTHLLSPFALPVHKLQAVDMR